MKNKIFMLFPIIVLIAMFIVAFLVVVPPAAKSLTHERQAESVIGTVEKVALSYYDINTRFPPSYNIFKDRLEEVLTKRDISVMERSGFIYIVRGEIFGNIVLNGDERFRGIISDALDRTKKESASILTAYAIGEACGGDCAVIYILYMWQPDDIAMRFGALERHSIADIKKHKVMFDRLNPK
jgi:hypothetical protein